MADVGCAKKDVRLFHLSSDIRAIISLYFDLPNRTLLCNVFSGSARLVSGFGCGCTSAAEILPEASDQADQSVLQPGRQGKLRVRIRAGQRTEGTAQATTSGFSSYAFHFNFRCRLVTKKSCMQNMSLAMSRRKLQCTFYKS